MGFWFGCLFFGENEGGSSGESVGICGLALGGATGESRFGMVWCSFCFGSFLKCKKLAARLWVWQTSFLIEKVARVPPRNGLSCYVPGAELGGKDMRALGIKFFRFIFESCDRFWAWCIFQLLRKASLN